MVGPTRSTPIRVAQEAKQINANLILPNYTASKDQRSDFSHTHGTHLPPTSDRSFNVVLYFSFFTLFSSFSLFISFLCFSTPWFSSQLCSFAFPSFEGTFLSKRFFK
ncbi:hypothetical protein VNO80_24402 [Phaseolus coccineus]|uniref:Uncharacterized protein n=1 Tax=Phaseolus coccineus TaxID=3886 RepID=A0AAN9LSR1_PHACN